MTKHFTFPPSIQSDLFNYLKPEHLSEFVSSIFPNFKKFSSVF